MIGTKYRQLPDGACRTVVGSNQLDLHSEIEPWIQVKELLFDDTYHSMVVDDKIS